MAYPFLCTVYVSCLVSGCFYIDGDKKLDFRFSNGFETNLSWYEDRVLDVRNNLILDLTLFLWLLNFAGTQGRQTAFSFQCTDYVSCLVSMLLYPSCVVTNRQT